MGLVDLSQTEFQPKKMNVEGIKEIKVSPELCTKLEQMFLEEEKGTVRVFENSAIVQTDKNFVFFAHQWLYLAVLCRRYAEAVKPYFDYLGQIMATPGALEAFQDGNLEHEGIRAILPSPQDREYMKRFIDGEESFRGGKKKLINNNGSSRGVKDIFGSCILSKISVPNASSEYLGEIVYYLVKRPELFDLVENEVVPQVGDLAEKENFRKIAKEIIDCIYKIDKLQAISELLEISEKSVKLDLAKAGGSSFNKSALRYLFALPSSKMAGSNRTFEEEYHITVEGKEVVCFLTTQWKGKELSEEVSNDGNYLWALIAVVNKYYSDYLKIIEKNGKITICPRFALETIPDVLKTEYARRFITSLLAKPFVILTGNSGTGKTRIAKQFAEFLEVLDDDGNPNWLIVPVGADWTDNTKILGFYNPLAKNGVGKYEKTDILRLLERANANPSVPYFLILDEMNLSHVERYFADFLSHMEMPDSLIKLEGYNMDDEESKEKGCLTYPDNLFVVGTVNIDETTYMFSPKVLDRANVIEFKPEKEDVLKVFNSKGIHVKIPHAGLAVTESFLLLAKTVRNGETKLSENDVVKTQNILRELYDVTSKKGFEFAYRTVKEIGLYIRASFELSANWSDIELFNAIDEQVLQKILPKIHGNKKEILDMLIEIEEICNQNGQRLGLSADKVEQMKGKLAAVQYASFI